MTKREQERLDVTHHMIFRTLGGRFWLAPIDEEKVQNVLDIGTGTGSREYKLSLFKHKEHCSNCVQWPLSSETPCPEHRYGHLHNMRCLGVNDDKFTDYRSLDVT